MKTKNLILAIALTLIGATSALAQTKPEPYMIPANMVAGASAREYIVYYADTACEPKRIVVTNNVDTVNPWLDKAKEELHFWARVKTEAQPAPVAMRVECQDGTNRTVNVIVTDRNGNALLGTAKQYADDRAERLKATLKEEVSKNTVAQNKRITAIDQQVKALGQTVVKKTDVSGILDPRMDEMKKWVTKVVQDAIDAEHTATQEAFTKLGERMNNVEAKNAEQDEQIMALAANADAVSEAILKARKPGPFLGIGSRNVTTGVTRDEVEETAAKVRAAMKMPERTKDDGKKKKDEKK
jgi:hypothetical protein